MAKMPASPGSGCLAVFRVHSPLTFRLALRQGGSQLLDRIAYVGVVKGNCCIILLLGAQVIAEYERLEDSDMRGGELKTDAVPAEIK